MEDKLHYPPKKGMTFRIDADIKTKLNELAEAKNQTPSKLINLIVKQFVNRNGIELRETSEENKITEISLLLQVQYLNSIGFEKYMSILKTLAKEQNISDEDMLKFLKTVLEYVWQSIKSKNI